MGKVKSSFDTYDFGVNKVGSIFLGKDIVVDGPDNQERKRRIRVQTHAHSDHTRNWIDHIRPGKALVTTEPTREILSLENPHLRRNGNVHVVGHGDTINIANLIDTNNAMRKIDLNDSSVTLYDANHMLGSVQVLLEDKTDGVRVLYSGDFGWPLDTIPEVDFLVLDATYTLLREKPAWTREEALSKFMGHITSNYGTKPIYVYARHGMMEELVSHIGANYSENVNFVASKKLIALISSQKNYMGFFPKHILDEETDEATNIRKQKIHLKSLQAGGSESFPGVNIKVHNWQPLRDTPEKMDEIDGEFRNIVISITNHAKGSEVLEYVERTGAKFVITDSYRNALNSHRLAEEICEKLNINAASADTTDIWKI